MIVALAGGIGGAKLLLGLSQILPPEKLFIVGNTGDDLRLHGLRICPDLDTLAYTLAGVVDPDTGWGVRQDTFHCLAQLERYGLPGWFRLGDRDLATHIHRTQMLARGESLAEATRRICSRLGMPHRLVPMCEGYHPTLLETDRGQLHLQEYLVRDKCAPRVAQIVYSDIEAARLPEAIAAAVRQADQIVICPSNPFISVGPILAVPGMREALKSSAAPVTAVSPIVGGRALKGPAAKMMSELGFAVSAASVAALYEGVIDRFILDRLDASFAPSLEKLGMEAVAVDTIMETLSDKVRLARQVVEPS